MKAIEIGEYIIPEDCRAIIANGKVMVFPRKQRTLGEGDYRCRDCVHYRIGQTSINQASYNYNYICEMRPKEVHNSKFAGQKLYYCALKYGKICEHFEKKGAEDEERG